MRSIFVLAVATTLALIAALVVPLIAGAHLGDPPLPTHGPVTIGCGPRPTNLGRSGTGGDHAIYVRESGTYEQDGVVLPVFETLEARYAGANREFTVEYWFKLQSGYDSNGKELFDHHVPSNEGFWTAFQDGELWAGIDTEEGQDHTAIHIQTGSDFEDGEWHHYALVRDLDASPGRLCLYLDGVSGCYFDGANSQWAHVYEDIRPPDNRDGDDDNNYPLYVIGARTNTGDAIEATIDELRVSDVARYRDDFTPPVASFILDANTVMLFHFDEGAGNTTYGYDSNSNAIEGTLVKDLGWYGVGATPLDPDDPTDAAWLDEMWVDGRFGVTPSTLTLTSPNGGELWWTGSEYQIRWTWTGTITHVGLSYSTDGFMAVNGTIVSSTSNDGSYTWTTPVTPSTTTRVRVADADNPALYDDSDADFSLSDTVYDTYLPMILKNWP
jgi:hypothetical protein